MDRMSHAVAEDGPFIDISDPYRLREWADTMDVSVDELRLAVNQVGPSLRTVRQYLGLG